MNQKRQTSAGTADTKEAQTNAEKAEEAWPNKHAWRLETEDSITHENKLFSFSHHALSADFFTSDTGKVID